MTSSIEWLADQYGRAGETWNPMIGCKKVSPGCFGCYAISTAAIRAGNPHPKIAAAFAGLTERTEDGLDWTGAVNLLPDRLDQPLRWKRGRFIFVNSLSDLFYEEVPYDFIVKVFAVMLAASQHVFIVLTKRHAPMRAVLRKPRFCVDVFECAVNEFGMDPQRDMDRWWPLPNLILGVSVENQKYANIRIPALLETPAAYRAVSIEPLVGPVSLAGLQCAACGGKGGWTGWSHLHGVDMDADCGRCGGVGSGAGLLDLVIVGGESGREARAMHPDWARRLRDECEEDDANFFFKQWGEWGPAPFIVRVDPEIVKGGTEEEIDAAKAASEAAGATHVHTGNPYLHEIGHKPWSLERCGLSRPHEPLRRWGKKRAGRTLDGREHSAMPVYPRCDPPKGVEPVSVPLVPVAA